MVGQGVSGALGFTEMAKVGEIPHGKAFLDLRSCLVSMETLHRPGSLCRGPLTATYR